MAINLLPLLILSLIAIAIFRPKQPQNNIEPGSAELPRAEPGAATGVIVGCPLIKDPHLVWQGDVKTIAIYTKSGKK